MNEERRPLIASGGLHTTSITLEEYGRAIRIKDSAFAATNHFIRQSRPFFPKRKFREYFYFKRMRWLIALLFLANFLCFDSLYMALAMDTVNLLLLFIFLQHQVVNCCTMTYVRSQPVIDSQQAWNTFYKFSVCELQGAFLQIYESGLGYVALSEQEVQVQVFNKVADMYMKHAQCYSIWFLLLIIFMASYSGFWSYAHWGEWKPCQQFIHFR